MTGVQNILQKIKDLFRSVVSDRKKLIIFILILAFLFTAILFIIIASGKDKTSTDQGLTAQKTQYFASLKFGISAIDLASTTLQSVPIILDAGQNTVKSIKFTVKFNPEVISSLDLVQRLDSSSALSNSLLTNDSFVALSEGYATIELTLRPNAAEQMGRGEIAQLSFTAREFNIEENFQFEEIVIQSDNLEADEEFNTTTNTLIITP